jgi:UDP-2-acetamido-2,6-beta-L-arabino-hexul-4-ose reductase
MFPFHSNETGSFQELAHASDVKFGQLSMLTIKEGCARGGHYHTRKEEWFCCIHGICEMELINIKTKERRVIDLLEGKREFVKVNPYESHTIANRSDMDCELLVIISEEYNEKDADTIKYGN